MTGIELWIDRRSKMLLEHYSASEKGRAVGRAMRLSLARGLSYMFCPSDHFAYMCHATERAPKWFLSPSNRRDYLELEGASELEPAYFHTVPEATAGRGYAIAKATGMQADMVFTIALRYGLCAYDCRQKSLRAVVSQIGGTMTANKLLADKKTYAGQAHFGDADAGTRCRSCKHIDPKANLRGDPTQGRCEIWAELMSVPIKQAPLFPLAAYRCKYYERKPDANLKVIK